MAQLDDTILKDLLEKEALGTLTSGERQLLDSWYDAFDTHQQHIEVFQDAAHEAQVKQRLLNRILEAGFPEQAGQQKPRRYRRLIQWSAAAAILLLIGSALFRKYITTPVPSAPTLLSQQTGQGQVQQFTLEDGTQVWLNARSTLRYSAHFDKHSREVYLEGEAYFDVPHDPQRQFVVHTDSLTTQVLGTAFSVTAYQYAAVQTVTVISGKVQVAHAEQVLGLLTPDKSIIYHPASGQSELTAVAATSLTAWKDGRLQFDNQDMEEIAERLGRWYGYTFRFENNRLKNCRYTASFNNHISLNDLLAIMKEISRVRYEIDTTQKTVTFLGTGCNE